MAIKFLSNESIDGTLEVGSFTVSGSGIVAAVGMTLQVDAGGVNAITIDNVGTVTTSGYLKIPNYLFHDGNTDTFLQFGTDTITLRGDSGITLDGPVTANETISITGNLTASRLFSGDGGNKTNPMIANGSDQDTGIFFPAANTMAFTAGDTEALRFAGANSTFAGSLIANNYISIKTASSSGSPYIDFLQNTTQKAYIQFNDGANALNFQSDNAFTFIGGSVERVRIDSSGNVGIGVTPSTIWSSSYDALQIGLGGSVYAHSSAGSSLNLGANIVYEGTAPNYYDKYLTSSTATKYQQDAGVHIWSTAVSGTAGDPVSWSERMRIDSSGNVGIGTEGTNIVVTGKGLGIQNIGQDTTASMRLTGANATGNPGVATYTELKHYGADLKFGINHNGGTDVITIDPSKNVGIGTTAPNNKLDVKISTANRTTLEPVMSVSAEGSGPYTGFGPKISFSSNIYYGAATGNPAGIIETAYIGAVMGTTYATNSDLVFATRDGATSVTEKMRILGNGNVGIGTTTPSRKLVVAQSDVTEPSGIDANTSILIKNNTWSGIQMISTEATGNFITFGDNANGFAGRIQYSHVTNAMQFETVGAEAMRITSAGRVAIGSTTASYGVLEIETESALAYSASSFTNGANIRLKSGGTPTTGTTTGVSFGAGGAAELYFGLEQQSSTLAHAIWQMYSGSAYQTNMRLSHDGTLTVKGDIVAYGSPSDKRLKENIKPIESALDKAMKLQGVTFDWKKSDSELNIKEDIGFIAQDVQKVLPELVRENEDGMLSMRHQGIAPILLEAIKELKAEIEELKKYSRVIVIIVIVKSNEFTKFRRNKSKSNEYRSW